jgi:hypothetical protein
MGLWEDAHKGSSFLVSLQANFCGREGIQWAPLCRWLKHIKPPSAGKVTNPNTVLVQVGFNFRFLWNLAKFICNYQTLI